MQVTQLRFLRLVPYVMWRIVAGHDYCINRQLQMMMDQKEEEEEDAMRDERGTELMKASAEPNMGLVRSQ